MYMYSQSGGKGNTHAQLSDSTNIGAISYFTVWTYEYAYHHNFRTVHQQNAALHVLTYALLHSNQFFAAPRPTFSQDGQILNLNDTEIKVFNQLQAKLQDILKAMKAIVGAHRKGRGKLGKASNADEMDVE